MENKTNERVPMAILSCFLIAFILQGILKISGVFVFEKALNWEIFSVIDNTKSLFVVFNIFMNSIAVYCMSFTFTDRPYSNKMHHYLIIILGTSIITACRILLKTPFYVEFIYDICLYVCLPLVVNLTTPKEHKFKLGIPVILALHIMLYFVYLGLGYWSNLLCSLLPVTQNISSASAHFLILFEMYIGLALLMLSMNLFIKKEVQK